MNDFLPASYEVPSTKGNYMKFKNGANRFRILSSPILGYEYWIEDDKGNRKPVRKHTAEEISLNDVEGENVKHFWAMPVWNYDEERVQILEITQKGIQRSLRALAKDEDWGSPLGYDIVVTRSGEKLETEYSLQPKPAKPVDKKITTKYHKMTINLEALYSGDDPFKSSMDENVNPDDVKV